ncbi:MAG TPA: methyl-accepting chemotaxis protein [bacterium]|nr:methyl-accepting chemotaxis protein [bacterium]
MTMKIAFVGGGDATLAFLKFLEKIPGAAEVMIVTDEFRDAPALRYAAERQLRVSTNHLDALKQPDLDVLFEIADSRADILALIREHLPKRTTLITSDQARVLYRLLSAVIEGEFSSIEERFMHNIKDIKKSIADFSTITKNIDILAINASIEAARAGEAGKGFAVVASSIKDLVKNSRDTLQYVRSVLEKLTLIHKDMQDTRKALKPKGDETQTY